MIFWLRLKKNIGTCFEFISALNRNDVLPLRFEDEIGKIFIFVYSILNG